MLIPFQKLLQHSTHGVSSRKFLLAASGPCLRAFDNLTGQFISKWSHLETGSTIRDELPGPHGEEGLGESPAKKRKLDSRNTSETPSAEIIIDNGSGQRNPTRHGFTTPCITHLLGTADGKHVVIVTGEDKSIRVLSVSEKGMLHQFSQRTLPKRPSALTLTPDQSTILCSDKFGDVYSLPLLGKSLQIVSSTEQPKDEDLASEEMFKPSASSKTVHTKRNLRALESQHKQKKVKKQSNQELLFEHELILGHVSLLTDIACVKVKAEGEGERTYILTSDRDEHIRVSRGIPQAHIIENFCLGHEHFINKMCIPSWQPEILISAGGDDYLLVWTWRNGSIKQKVDLKGHILPYRPDSAHGSPSQIAVSGIWSMKTSSRGQIIVACEAACTLLFFGLSSDGTLDSEPSFQVTLSHNVLDVAISPEEQTIIISIDNAHKSWTTHDAATDNHGPFIVKFKFDPTDRGKWSQIEESSIQQVNDFGRATIESSTDSLDASALGDAFYNVEHLRKRGGPEGVEEIS